MFAANSPVITNNTISGNSNGAITIVNGGSPVIVQNLIVANHGMGISAAMGTIVNNTIADNDGGGIVPQFGVTNTFTARGQDREQYHRRERDGSRALRESSPPTSKAPAKEPS